MHDKVEQAGSLRDVMSDSTCPACGHHVAVRFFAPGALPLTTLAWPRDPDEAQSMARLPHAFVRCVDCGHVYNAQFDYAQVPYSDKPNLMFNQGALWQEHLKNVCQLILDHLSDAPTVVEIGCGDGHLLRALAQARPNGRYIGYDPNAQIDTSGGRVEARAVLFDPAVHIRECQPELIISRHVLEHLMNPLGFVQALAFAAGWERIETQLFLEVPCIDKAIREGRTSDFFYEHNSHFTAKSLDRMLTRCATKVELIQTAYSGEVLCGLARFVKQAYQLELAEAAQGFYERSIEGRARVNDQLEQLHRSGQRIAVWGGTGKAAAFINQHGLDDQRFPIVVDSDPNKAGTFVPGTGQPIHFRDFLKEQPVDVILIATQWRSADIVLEIEREGIPYQSILIEHMGSFVDYFQAAHPYHILIESPSAPAPPPADRKFRADGPKSPIPPLHTVASLELRVESS